jgi:acyl-CoA thioesterase
MSLFETDTAVERINDHRFAATVTDRWNGLAGRPLGGYVLATCLRALRTAVPFPDVLAASAFFLCPVEPGSVDITVEVARTGRSTATGEVRLYQEDTEALRCVATFGNLEVLSGQHLVVTRPPPMVGPDDAIDLHDGGSPPTASIADRVEYRVPETLEQRHRRRREEAVTALWMRLKEGGAVDSLAAAFFVDAAPPAVMAIGATGSTTVELTLYVRGLPRSEWLACRATTCFISNGYHEEDLELWDDHGRLVAQSRQLARIPKADRLGGADRAVIEAGAHRGARP